MKKHTVTNAVEALFDIRHHARTLVALMEDEPLNDVLDRAGDRLRNALKKFDEMTEEELRVKGS